MEVDANTRSPLPWAQIHAKSAKSPTAACVGGAEDAEMLGEAGGRAATPALAQRQRSKMPAVRREQLGRALPAAKLLAAESLFLQVMCSCHVCVWVCVCVRVRSCVRVMISDARVHA